MELKKLINFHLNHPILPSLYSTGFMMHAVEILNMKWYLPEQYSRFSCPDKNAVGSLVHCCIFIWPNIYSNQNFDFPTLFPSPIHNWVNSFYISEFPFEKLRDLSIQTTYCLKTDYMIFSVRLFLYRRRKSFRNSTDRYE